MVCPSPYFSMSQLLRDEFERFSLTVGSDLQATHDSIVVGAQAVYDDLVSKIAQFESHRRHLLLVGVPLTRIGATLGYKAGIALCKEAFTLKNQLENTLVSVPLSPEQELAIKVLVTKVAAIALTLLAISLAMQVV